MKPRDLIKLGFAPGPAIGVAIKVIPEAKRALGARALEQELAALVKNPTAYTSHAQLGALAEAVIAQEAARVTFSEREAPAPYQIWGANLESGALEQMRHAARLPVAVSGALMPDAH